MPFGGTYHYGAAKHLADNAQNELFKLAGGIIASETKLFDKTTALLKPCGLDVTISHWSTYRQAWQQLVSMISQPEAAKTKLRLDQMKKECDAFSSGVTTLLSARDAFVGPYNELAEDRSTVSQLNIAQFLHRWPHRNPGRAF